MLQLSKLEIEGFGPFAERETLAFPSKPGVTVVYGENMRGKTSLLNAVRYAFFGTVLGRGARARRLHTISNRERASEGQFGFRVALSFVYDGVPHELVRDCVPNTDRPLSDDDYTQSVMLRRGATALGPQERERALQQIFPREVSRFFLFDGELLQEYEELLINESEAGPRISEAIERILGVPILRRGRLHLTQLSDEADKLAAKEASKHQATQGLGNSLQQAAEQKEAHQSELQRLHVQLEEFIAQRTEIDQQLQSKQKYASILQERDQTQARFDQAVKEEKTARGDLQRLMSQAWRSLVREPVRTARAATQADVEDALGAFTMTLRTKALESLLCGTCEQSLSPEHAAHLRSAMSDAGKIGSPERLSRAVARLGHLNQFLDADNAGEVRALSRQVNDLALEQATLREHLADLDAALADSDPDALRRGRAKYGEVVDKISGVKRAIDEEVKYVDVLDQNIQRLKKKLEASGTSDQLRVSQRHARLMRDSAEIFAAAVEQYKTALRARVEATASTLFRSMTTEKQDYLDLKINEAYGLTIRHRDGRAEEARSAGAEHVVALALMGALQRNAPLRGPIVMDSPFGRLDEQHTSNVVQALPQMADQVVLLVYEAEVGRDRMRELLGKSLLGEYQLDRVSARRSTLRPVR